VNSRGKRKCNKTLEKKDRGGGREKRTTNCSPCQGQKRGLGNKRKKKNKIKRQEGQSPLGGCLGRKQGKGKSFETLGLSPFEESQKQGIERVCAGLGNWKGDARC